MKKILLLLSLAVLLGACNDTETPAPESPFARAESHVRSLIEKFGDYDPAEVESMIAGKMLTLSVRLEYNESRTEVIGVPYAFGESNEGVQADRYLLRRDGSCTRYYWTDGGWLRAEGSWSLDSEARTLQIMDDIVEIVALGPYSIIWDKETCEIPGSKPRSLIDNYIIEPLDPNFPDPRPDTHYEEIEVLGVTASQILSNNDPGRIHEYWANKWFDTYYNRFAYLIPIVFFFPDNELNQTLSAPLYVTVSTNSEDFYVADELNYDCLMGWRRYDTLEKNNEWIESFSDQLFQTTIGLNCNKCGIYDFELIIYHPETGRYFVSQPMQLNLEETGTYYVTSKK